MKVPQEGRGPGRSGTVAWPRRPAGYGEGRGHVDSGADDQACHKSCLGLGSAGEFCLLREAGGEHQRRAHTRARGPAERAPRPGAQTRPGHHCSEQQSGTGVQGRRGQLSVCAPLPWCKGEAQRLPQARRTHARVREEAPSTERPPHFSGEAGAGQPVLDAPRGPLGLTEPPGHGWGAQAPSEQDQGVTAGF